MTDKKFESKFNTYLQSKEKKLEKILNNESIDINSLKSICWGWYTTKI